MIQQYGPLVRNLPAMIKLYSQLGSADDDEESANDADAESAETSAETEVPEEEAQTDEIEKIKNQKTSSSKKQHLTHHLLLKQNRKKIWQLCSKTICLVIF